MLEMGRLDQYHSPISRRAGQNVAGIGGSGSCSDSKAAAMATQPSRLTSESIAVIRWLPSVYRWRWLESHILRS